MLRGSTIELYGCDIHAEGYQAFFDFAGLRYQQLKHHYSLTYEDIFFDAVIGTAALEHLPNDSESLNELYRVIKPVACLSRQPCLIGSPPALYCPKNGVWVSCGESGGGRPVQFHN
jgi:Methyltransferase domain